MRLFRRRSKNKTAAPTSNLDQTLVLHLSKSRIPGLRQLKYVGRFLSSTERIALNIFLLLALGSLIFMGTVFYRNNIESVPREGGRYTEGVIGNPQYVNPLYAPLNDADADIERLVFSRLFTRDQKGSVVADLVESFEISADQKTYTLKLKDARWHNGENLTADDVIFTFNLIGDPSYKSPLRMKFSGISAARLDERTVQFSLPEAYGDFPRLLDFGIMPQHAWEAVSVATMPLAELNTKPIGSGPYRFKSLTKSRAGTIRTYTLERNPDYYGSAPYLDEIVFRFFPSAEEAIASLNNGQLSALSYLESGLADSIVAKNSLDYHSIALTELNLVFFNLKSKGLVADKTLRQALSAALDPQSVTAESVGRWGVATSSLIPGFMPGSEGAFKSDLARSNQLLDQTGWLRVEGQEWRMKNNQPLTVTLTALETAKPIAEAIARQWAQVGVKADLALKNAETIKKEAVENKQFDILLYSEVVTNGDPYPLWQAEATANLSGWSRSEADTWLKEARLASNSEERAKRYRAFEAVAADDVPAIPIFWSAYVYPQSKKLKGFSLSSIQDPGERFSGADDWHLKTTRRLKQD